METKKTDNIYFNMAWGTLGMIFVVFGFIKYISVYNDFTNIFLTWLGFMIMVHYIYSLERKVGVNNKLIWIRVIILILTLIIGTIVVY